MVKQGKHYTIISHASLLIGVIIMLFPVYIAWVASTHTSQEILSAPFPIKPGSHWWPNLKQVLFQNVGAVGNKPIWLLLRNSFIMAMSIAVGKISVSILSAYAIVYFRFPFRNFFFWIIFATLMLPVEVRILPTFQVVAGFHLLNTFTGLSLPLIASATATFLFRQFFMTVPAQLVDAARIDGAGPIRFFWDILLPISRTNIAALFIILFIYGWNQYLWPLVVTTQSNRSTILMGVQQLALVADQIPEWNIVMTVAFLAILPPVLVVLLMQHWFVKGLTESEK